MSKNMMLALLAVGAFYLYSKKSASGGPGFQTCKFPNGDVITVPAGSACPYDGTKGGQSALCYPPSFVGPLPDGASYC